LANEAEPGLNRPIVGPAPLPVVKRTSISGSALRNAARREISQRIAKVGPTPLLTLLLCLLTIGTVLAKRFLEAMADTQYRTWAGG